MEKTKTNWVFKTKNPTREINKIINFLSGHTDKEGVAIDQVFLVSPLIGDCLLKVVSQLAHSGVKTIVVNPNIKQTPNELEQISQQEILEKITCGDLPQTTSYRQLIIYCQ